MSDERYQEIKILQVGAPMILGGKNFPECLHVDKAPGLRIVYDNVDKIARVTWNGETADVPMFIYKIPGRAKVYVAPPAPAPIVGKIQAQVGGPQHHVHAGLGHGQTGQGE